MHFLQVNVFIKDQTEYWKRCVNSRITDDQEAIVNWNRHLKKHYCENCLDHRDNHAPMHDKLRKFG